MILIIFILAMGTIHWVLNQKNAQLRLAARKHRLDPACATRDAGTRSEAALEESLVQESLVQTSASIGLLGQALAEQGVGRKPEASKPLAVEELKK